MKPRDCWPQYVLYIHVGAILLLPYCLEAKLYPKKILGYDRLSERIMDAMVDDRKSMNQPNGCAIIRDQYASPIAFVADPAAGRFEFYRYRAVVGDDDTIQLSAFGSWGSANGQYQSPNDIATLDETHLYILDTGNNRIGRAVFNLGDYGISPETPIGAGIGLSNPLGFGLYESTSDVKIYVADTKNHRIARLSESGILEAAYGSYGAGVGQFNNPRDICRSGNYIYIADTYNNRIVVLLENPNGSYEWYRTYAIPTIYNMITSLDCDQNGNVYCIDNINCQVIKFSEGLDEHLWTIGSRGCFADEYEYPRGIAVSHECNDALITETYAEYTGLRFLQSSVDIMQAQAYPQHFDATIPGEYAQISFKIDDVASVSVEVLEGNTHVCWLIQNLMLCAGSHSESFLIWDGTDDNENLCLPSVYTVKIIATDAYDNVADTMLSVVVEGTQVWGLQITDLDWNSEGEPYVLIDDVILHTSTDLYIGPGVKVMPTGDFVLKTTTTQGYQGSIKARGSEGDSILFTPHRKLYPLPVTHGQWKGIRFNSNYNEDSLVLEYCTVEAAGSDSAAIIHVGQNHSVSRIVNTTITASGSYGYWEAFLRAYGGGRTRICHSVFSENNSVPIRVGFSSIGDVHDNTFTSNAYDVIEILPGTLLENAVIVNEGVPYWLRKWPGHNSIFAVSSYSSEFCVQLGIEPDVQLFFEDSTKLECNGGIYNPWRAKIVAQGNVSDSIVFTALDQDKGWGGIRLTTHYPADTSIFEYCRISYGGCSTDDNESGNLYSKYGHSPYVLQNSNVSYSKTIGVGHQAGGDISMNPIVKDNQFSNNDSFPLVIYANALRDLDNNTFTDNERNEIVILGEHVNESLTWRNQGVPYICNSTITIQSTGGNNTVLDIESGNVIKFKSGVQLCIETNSRLIARSTVFTRADAEPWGQIKLNSADTSLIDSCTIEYTKDMGFDGAVCAIESPIVLTNSRISNNDCGIGIHGGLYARLVGNYISLNKVGVQVNSSMEASVLIKDNDICGNQLGMGHNAYNPPYVQADLNWWGDMSGPWDPSPTAPDYNPTGRGDSISNGIVYREWLETPVHKQTVTLSHPNGGELFYSLCDASIEWTTNVTAIRQELYYTTDFPEGGREGGEFWQFIDTVTPGETRYNWNVASTPSNRCRIAVKLYYDTESKYGNPGSGYQWRTDSDNRETEREEIESNSQLASESNRLLNDSESRGAPEISVDISDANFTIIDTVSPEVSLAVPNSGEYFIPTKQETIRWQASDNHKLNHFDIYLSTDGGSNYAETIIEHLQAPCSTYIWTPTEENCYICKMKVVAWDSSDNCNEDISDALFYIPVKSALDEMTAYNNARRLARNFSTNLHLVYSTQNQTRDFGDSQKLAYKRTALKNQGKIVDGPRHVIKDQPGRYPKSFTDMVYYTHSTNLGDYWQTPIEVGEGSCPSIAINEDASIIGVAWTNSSGSKILYRYCLNGQWSSLIYTIIDSVIDIFYSPVALQFDDNTMCLATLKTTYLSGDELTQEVIYNEFPYNNPSNPTGTTIDHWRICGQYEPLPKFVSLSVDYNGDAHFAWEKPPGDTMFTPPFDPFDIFYCYESDPEENKYNISNSEYNSINPSIDCYGGHAYVVWQEDFGGYNIFLYKRNYVSFPPKVETDTISATADNSLYPVSRMGGVVLWAEGDPPEIYGRIRDSKQKYWLDIENWSNTPEISTYPQVDAWQNEGGTDIIGCWTEDADTSGLGKNFTSFLPGGDRADVAFPSYCLEFGDSMSTPFTEYRDSVAAYGSCRFDYGADSLIYYLPYVSINSRCKVRLELYRPESTAGNWRVRVKINNALQFMLNLTQFGHNVWEYDIPTAVHYNGDLRIKFQRISGGCILAERLLLYEYESIDKQAGMFASGPQSSNNEPIGAIFFDGIYPNPGYLDTRVKLNAPQECNVAVKLYDVSGRLVNEPFRGKVLGSLEIPLVTKELATGIYFVRIETDSQVITEKVILLR